MGESEPETPKRKEPQPLVVQIAMASWLAPVLAAVANGYANSRGQEAPIVPLLMSLALMLAVLFGLACALVGLVAASRIPEQRGALLRHAIPGAVISGLCALLLIGGFVFHILDRPAN